MSNLFFSWDKCRTCGHKIVLHSEYAKVYDLNRVRFIISKPCWDRDMMFQPCNCNKFEPEDNLRYLEMKVGEL